MTQTKHTPDISQDAARELLEALEALLGMHIAHHNAPEHAAARAAIAKARGQE